MSRLGQRFPRVNKAAHVLHSVLRLYRANRSRRAWGTLLRHMTRKLLGRPAPLFLHIEPTYRCQCRCVHCCADSPRGDGEPELITDQIKSLIDEAAQIGFLQIIFTGGESLLRRDIDELVHHAHQAGLLTRINTNGVLLDRDHVHHLKAAGLTECAVSIDDADPAAHDRLRGRPGTFQAAIRGIELLKEYGISARLQICAMRHNVPDGLRALIALARKLGMQSVRILPVKAVGRWEAASDEILSEEEMNFVRTLQDVRFVGLELATSSSVCAALKRNNLRITPQGEVTLCPVIPFVIGNVRSHSLAEIWRAHCATPLFTCRGECPLNSLDTRAALERYAASVAKRLEG